MRRFALAVALLGSLTMTSCYSGPHQLARVAVSVKANPLLPQQLAGGRKGERARGRQRKGEDEITLVADERMVGGR